MLTVTVRKAGKTSILELAGRLTIGEPITALQDEIHNQVRSGCRDLFLDLSNVSYIDSFGIGTLVSLYTSAANQGGMISIRGLKGPGGRLLDMTGLNR